MPASDPASLGERLAALTGRWSSLAELCGDAAEPAPDPALLVDRRAGAAWLSGALADADAGPVAELRARQVQWLHRRHQYLALDDEALAELTALLRGLLAGLAGALGRDDDAAAAAGVRTALAGHRAGLAALVRARLGERPRDVVCAEYSPALQLELLGLSAATLDDPVLDLGCGPAAALVRALRAAGRDAHGLDREAPADVATVGDWLRFDYGVERWGTVVSHHAFTLHFLHHHLRPGPRALAYAETFMAVLRALRPGGRFAYAPGLPFLEGMLPRATYRVTRVPLPATLRTPAAAAMQAETGLRIEHATQVLRVG